MHTYVGPNRTVFHFNSDLSGDVEVSRSDRTPTQINGEDLAGFIWSHKFPGEASPDRERIEFVRRAAIAFRATRADWAESECVKEAADLWDALQKAGC